MALFNDVFNKASIYEMLFLNVKAVLIYPTLKSLEEKNKPLYDRWKNLAERKYDENSETVYQKNAPYYPEYSRIVAITYATLYHEDGSLKRFFKKIVNEDEYIVLATLFDVLNQLSSDGAKSNPPYYPILCGHNITGHDIPFLIKRFMVHKDAFQSKQIPLILKNTLSIKPWESGVIDTVNVWKFNGYETASLMLIADFLGLKKTTELLPLEDLSKFYWDNVEAKPQETLEAVCLQSATQTNLVIQLMNELRQL